MLTEKGIRERKWGAYPELRKVLENRPIPDRYYGITSVDDNIFDEVRRYLEIAVVFEDAKDQVLQNAPANPRTDDPMDVDLMHLAMGLRHIRSRFDDAARTVAKIRAKRLLVVQERSISASQISPKADQWSGPLK